MAALTNLITIGPRSSPIVQFTNGSMTNTIGIQRVGGIFGVDVVGNQLSIDTITAVVQYGKPNGQGFDVWEVYEGPGQQVYQSPDGTVYRTHVYDGTVPADPTWIDLRSIPYGTPVFWDCAGRQMAAFYLKSVERVGRYLWRITAISGIGLLDSLYHNGGVFAGQTFIDVARAIIGGTASGGTVTGGVFPFSVVGSLLSQKIYGWLPYDTCRNNLHRLLFAMGASVRRDTNGVVQFAFLSNAGPKSVPDSRVAFGGTVDYSAPASGVEITEHAYLVTDNDETVTLFDNTQGGSGPAASTLVVFDEAPVHNLVASSGLTINASGVNYARLTGTGVLTGKKYTHNTRVVTRSIDGTPVQQNIRRVTDNGLVCIANSSNVAKRVLAYYSSAKTVRAKIALEGERCGDILSLKDPYYEPMTAFLESADVNASGNLLGSCTLIEGYTPTGQGNNVTGSAILTGSGTWTSPVTGTVTAVLIGGGQGGGAGNAGEAAAIPPVKSSQRSYSGPPSGVIARRELESKNLTAGAGGAAGNPGNGGKVSLISFSVSAGQQISYSCGVGGAGAAFGSSGLGAAGGNTTFASYSSASGATSPTGYIDPVSGNQYGMPGQAGMAGSEGVGYKTVGGVTSLYTPPAITVGGASYTAGGRGQPRTGTYGATMYGYGYNLQGGYGGGPAYGASGAAGTMAAINNTGSSSYLVMTVNPGGGGKGADAQPYPKETTYGRGGRGGNGGGGGGAFGYVSWFELDVDSSIKNWALEMVPGGGLVPVGAGGSGSAGGQGADGCVLLYWGE